MSDAKNTTIDVDDQTVNKAREIILGISPVKFLRTHEPEALAQTASAVGKVDTITPEELTAIIANSGDLKEDLQRLINSRELQTELTEIGFNARETELIGEALSGVIRFLNSVILPLLEHREDYAWIWYELGSDANPLRSFSKVLGKQEALDEKPKVRAKEILGRLDAEIQLKDHENKVTPMVIETLTKLLPEEICEELAESLKAILET